MTVRTKERLVCILFGVLGIALGGWLCWLSVGLIGTCEADDWVGLGAGMIVGGMGVVLCLACAGIVGWMVEDGREERDCAE